MRYSHTERIITLASLCLFFSYIENIIPHPLPFLRLGLANIPLLVSLPYLPFSSFMTLALLKATSGAFASGTLFSLFFLLSLSSSVSSALLMFLAKKILKGKVSIYGISLIGGFASSAVQIALSSLYLGRGMMSLFPVLSITSLFTCLITACIAGSFEYENIRTIAYDEEKKEKPDYLLLSSLVIPLFLTEMIKNTVLLLILFSLILIISALNGRKIRLALYIALYSFAIFSSLFTPRGEVLFSIFSLPVTKLSLSDALLRASRLSVEVSLSLLLSRYIKKAGKLSLVVYLSTLRINTYNNTEGRIRYKIRKAIEEPDIINVKNNMNKISRFILILILFLFILSFSLDFSFFQGVL